jgi:hypothetical protein
LVNGNPAFMALPADEGQSRIALRLQTVVFLIQAFLGVKNAQGLSLESHPI